MQAPESGSRLPHTGIAAKRRRFLIWALNVLVAVVVLWLLVAYLVLPALWRHYEHHPALENAPKTSQTAQDIPGDPLNVGLIGTKDEVVQAMLSSGWHAADAITLKSSLHIASSVVRDRPYAEAPVSSLYVFGRKQDLAFEKPVGDNPSRRHHVRFWKSNELGQGGVPLWIGAVTYDKSVGFSEPASHRFGARPACWWTWLMAVFLPLVFIIPLVVWLVSRAVAAAWNLVFRKQPAGGE